MQAFGRFQIIQKLGSGTYATVYRAADPTLDREVALKIMRKGTGGVGIERFVAEARSVSTLRHPQILPVLEIDVVDGCHYIAFPYIQGESLAERVEHRRPTFQESAEWIRNLASALHYAHQSGVIHRDVKPGNILIDGDGNPTLIDFGIAAIESSSEQTGSNDLLGTPAYMSPEQAAGDVSRIGPATDQYSLGCVLYELLSGQRPFDGSPHAILEQLVSSEPPRLNSLDRSIPHDLEAIAQRAMCKDVAGRYVDLAEMADDLERWLEGRETIARSRSKYEQLAAWYRGNPLLAISNAAAGLLLITAAAIGGFAYVSASAALTEAVAAEQELQESIRRAQSAITEADQQTELATSRSQQAARRLQQANEFQSKAEQATQLASEAKAAALEDERRANEAAAKIRAEIKLAAALKDERANLIAEQGAVETEVLLGEQTHYAEQLAAAQRQAMRGDFEGAADLLDQCDPAQRGWEWHYVKAMSQRQAGKLWQHTLDVPGFVDFHWPKVWLTADGDEIVAVRSTWAQEGRPRSGYKTELVAWNAASGAVQAQLVLPAKVEGSAIAPNGAAAGILRSNGEISVFGRIGPTFQTIGTRAISGVHSIGFSGAGELIAGTKAPIRRNPEFELKAGQLLVKCRVRESQRPIGDWNALLSGESVQLRGQDRILQIEDEGIAVLHSKTGSRLLVVPCDSAMIPAKPYRHLMNTHLLLAANHRRFAIVSDDSVQRTTRIAVFGYRQIDPPDGSD